MLCLLRERAYYAMTIIPLSAQVAGRSAEETAISPTRVLTIVVTTSHAITVKRSSDDVNLAATLIATEEYALKVTNTCSVF